MDENESQIRRAAAERVDHAAKLFLKGRHSEAVEDLQAAIRMNPQNATAHGNLGYIYLMLREPEKAIGFLERALELDPELEGVSEALDSARRAAAQNVVDTGERQRENVYGDETDEAQIIVPTQDRPHSVSPEAASSRGVRGPVLLIAGLLIVGVLGYYMTRSPEPSIEIIELPVPDPVAQTPTTADDPMVSEQSPSSESAAITAVPLSTDTTEGTTAGPAGEDRVPEEHRVASETTSLVGDTGGTSSAPESIVADQSIVKPTTAEPVERAAESTRESIVQTADTDLTERSAEPAALPATDAPSYLVQLGAFSAGESAAETAWSQLVTRHPSLLEGLSPQIDTAESAGGTLHRLKAGPVTEEQARSICTELTAADQPCFVVHP